MKNKLILSSTFLFVLAVSIQFVAAAISGSSSQGTVYYTTSVWEWCGYSASGSIDGYCWDASRSVSATCTAGNVKYTWSGFSDSYLTSTWKGECIQTCTPSWDCSGWSSCITSNECSTSASGTQSRACYDSNNCGTTSGKPAESQSCTISRNTEGNACSTVTGLSGTCQSGSCVAETCTGTQPSQSLQLSNGCQLTISALGWTNNNNGGGKYKSSTVGADSIKTVYVDAGKSSCAGTLDVGVRFNTLSSSGFSVSGAASRISSGGPALSYGHVLNVNSNNCKVLAVGGCAQQCPTLSTDKRNAQFLRTESIASYLPVDYTVGECLTNSDCSSKGSGYTCDATNKCKLTTLQPPTLTQPSDASSLTTITPTLTWDRNTNNPANADYYQWYVRTAGEPRSTASLAGRGGSTSSTSSQVSVTVSSGKLSYGTTYYWSVAQCTSLTACSDYAPEKSFTPASSCTYGTCSEPKTLGTLDNYGNGVSASTCTLTSAKQNDMFKISVKKAGYAIVSVTNYPTVGIDGMFKYNTVAFAGQSNVDSGKKISFASNLPSISGSGSFCTGDVLTASDSAGKYSFPVTAGSYNLVLTWGGGTGSGDVNVKLGECILNSDCSKYGSGTTCDLVTNKCNIQCDPNRSNADGTNSACPSDKKYCSFLDSKCHECLNNDASGTSSQCPSDRPKCETDSSKSSYLSCVSVECTSNNDLNGDGIDNDQCRSLGTSGVKCAPPLGNDPNRIARCDTVAKTCSVCGPCVTNSDCGNSYCCPGEGLSTTGNPGPADTSLTRQCYSVGVYTNTQYLCKAG